jgi:hypothetical protein
VSDQGGHTSQCEDRGGFKRRQVPEVDQRFFEHAAKRTWSRFCRLDDRDRLYLGRSDRLYLGRSGIRYLCLSRDGCSDGDKRTLDQQAGRRPRGRTDTDGIRTDGLSYASFMPRMKYLHASTHFLAAIALAITWSAPVVAQGRTDEIAKQQEQKAQTTTPYSPNRVEVFLDQVEQGKWILGVPRGWYFAMGSVYPGGGLAGGAGYRHYIGYDSYVDSSAVLSLKGYKRLRLTGYTPNHVNGRVDLEGSIVWLDATQIAFYGLGNASQVDNRTNFRINRSYAEGAAIVRPRGATLPMF